VGGGAGKLADNAGLRSRTPLHCRMLHRLLSVRSRSLAALLAPLALVALWALPLISRADDFLAPEKAFQVSARAADERNVEVRFVVAPGYYLYREQLKFEAPGAQFGAPALPQGKVKFDETFRKNVETYRGELRVQLPVTQAPAVFRMKVMSQGCADQGLCYPPMPTILEARLAGFGGNGDVRVIAQGDAALQVPLTVISSDTANGPAPASDANNETSLLENVLRSGSFWQAVLAFFGAGLLLSLTPCVLPMLPILSSIIVGQKHVPVSRARGLALATGYALGMALVYTLFGIAAGLAGEGLAATLQTPLVLGGFALLLGILSLSMFGFYDLQLPNALANGLTRVSQRLNGGNFAGVFAMGGLSALIVSPCVAAPLAGALVYLSHTRDVWLGGSALFALAMGMSVPLLLVGASAGALLPKAGAWMEGVKRFFGVLLLAVAMWLVQPVLPARAVLVGWGALLLLAAVLMWPRGEARSAGPAVPVRRAGAGVLAALALLQLVGAASGARDPLQPLAHIAGGESTAVAPLPFRTIRSVAELDAALASAKGPVMLDFYADWCVSCKEMERFTFSEPSIHGRLAQATLLKADVTANTADDRALLRRFTLFGPPATLFFDPVGRELRDLRLVGFQDAARFARTLDQAGL
jgi:thiol:disulfide interchange protein DsbD